MLPKLRIKVECVKLKTTEIFVETDEHHGELKGEAMRSFNSRKTAFQSKFITCLKESICIQVLFHSIFFIFTSTQTLRT